MALARRCPPVGRRRPVRVAVAGIVRPTVPAVLAVTACVALLAVTAGLPEAAGAGTVAPHTRARQLDVIACPSADDCIAFGDPSARWDGSTWRPLASSLPAPLASPTTVAACPSRNSCVVGWAKTGGGSGAPTTPYVSTWNGSRWSTVRAILPAGDQGSLQTAGCTDRGTCFVAGTYGRGSFAAGWPLFMHKTGKGWLVMRAARPRGTSLALINSLACASSTRCFGVGFEQRAGSGTAYRTLIEQWTPSTGWQLDSSYTPRGTNGLVELSGVSCAGGSCLAVGQYAHGAGFPTSSAFAESWSGGRWSATGPPADPPSPFSVVNDSFTSVSCATAGVCMALAEDSCEPFGGCGWPELWHHGAFTAEPYATPGLVSDTRLWSLACTGPTTCLAVGARAAGGRTTPLGERWDGTAWTVVATPK